MCDMDMGNMAGQAAPCKPPVGCVAMTVGALKAPRPLSAYEAVSHDLKLPKESFL